MNVSGPSTRTAALLAGLAVPWAVGLSLLDGGPGDGAAAAVLATDILVGWAFVGAGLIAWRRRPASLTGLLMIIAGYAWFLRNLWVSEEVPWLLTAAPFIGTIVNPILAHLVLAFPAGRLEHRGDRRLVVAIYFWGFLLALPIAMTEAPAEWGCVDCDQDGNRLLVDAGVDVFTRLSFVGAAVFTLLVIVAFGRRWRRATPPQRRILAPVLLTGLVAATVALLGLLIPPLVYDLVPPGGGPVALATGNLSIALVPLGFLTGLLRTRLTRTRLGDLVEALGHAPTPAELRDHLARALGDPSLRVGYWAADLARYVDASGEPFEPPAGSAVVEGPDGPLAVLVHDPVLLEDPGLVEAVAAAARLALENARLQAEVRAQLAEVRASRTRIVSAGDAQRRRIERDLHDGAQQRLVALAISLRMLRRQAGDSELSDLLEEAEVEARTAIDELRDLARGIHPQLLTSDGLPGALRALADRSPLVVALAVDVPERPSSEIEAGVYFVIAEALANAAKYAPTATVQVSARARGDELEVLVTDDGPGGAVVRPGGGLHGLADRVAALGGRMEVSSDARGTTVRASVPLAVTIRADIAP